MPATEGDIKGFGMVAVWGYLCKGIKNARKYVERLNRTQGSRQTAMVL